MKKFPRIFSCLLVLFFSSSVASFAFDLTSNRGLASAESGFQVSDSALPDDVKSQIKAAMEGHDADSIARIDPDLKHSLQNEDEVASGDAGGESVLEEAKGAVEPKEKFSKIEQQYRQGYGSLLSNELHQFGYEIFQSSVDRTSRLAIPDDNYLLGPGDKLRIRIWGTEVDAEFIGSVGRNGSINVPRIGIVPVAGVRFGAVESVIRKEAEKYIQGININVSLQELRSVEVYVVGAVNAPGLHMVPAFSTVLGGLLSSGGVKKSGSLRLIELYRNGKLFKKIDLYDLLLAGKRDFDVVLADKDVVFVPRLGRTVAVAGAVSEEGIFELRNEKTVGDLFELSGGILPQGSTGRMYLRRYLQNLEFSVRDISTRVDNESWKAIPVHSGDLLELQYLLPDWPKVVKLEGHVRQPDLFEYQDDLTLSAVLLSPDLLMPGAVTDFALLYRYDPDTTRFQVRRFPLSRVFDHEFDLDLQPYDRIVILSRENLGIREEVTVHGGVWKDGTFVFRPGLTLADAVAMAGGVKFGARLDGIEISRKEIVDDQATTTQLVLELAKDGDFALQAYDDIFIPEVKDATLQKHVTIDGQVKYPGSYVIHDGDRVSDLIRRAGGFLDDAYLYGANYSSVQAQQIQQQSIDRMVQELEVRARQAMVGDTQTAIDQTDAASSKAAEASITALLNKMKMVKAKGRVSIKLSELETFTGTEQDFLLEAGDSLTIPRLPNFVAAVGSVYLPSAYHYESGKTLGYYLDKSGGPTKTADDDNIYLLKASGEVVAKSRLGMFASFKSVEVEPGDTIVVPEDLERLPYLRLVSEVSDIVFKIATTAGIAIAVL